MTRSGGGMTRSGGGMTRRGGVALLLAAAVAAGGLWLFRPREWRYGAPAMGTHATLTIVGTPFEKLTGKTGRAAGRAMDEIAAIERLMSIYRPESDVGRLNRDGGSREVEVAARTFEVLGRSVEIARLTGGAFNVCVLPAEEAWGFKTDKPRRVPATAAPALPLIGGRDIAMREEAGRRLVRFPRRGVRVDLGGIGAGYAVDRVVEILKAEGVRGALVDIGGDMYCLGRGARGEAWRVGVRHPRTQELLTALSLSDRAVTTSGDYEDFFLQDGKRYSHIFDPRTGRPAARGVVSATVIADSCTVADALATALIVLGAEDALRLVERMPRTECILVTEENGELRVRSSSGGRAEGRKK